MCGFRMPDMSTFIRQLMDPRPLVMVSGHSGNFEVGGVLGGLMGFPTFAVARSLDNPLLDRFINRFASANRPIPVAETGQCRQVDACCRKAVR